MSEITIKKIKEAFSHRRPGIIGSRGEFSVLVPLVKKDGELHLLYELRSEKLGRQPGEVCFPGGQIEKDETPEACAVRETVEETGVGYGDIEVFAQMDTVYNYNNITLYCFIGLIEYEKLKAAKFSESEVAELFLVPVDFFEKNPPDIQWVELKPVIDEDFPYEKINSPNGYNWKNGKMAVPIYLFKDKVIWGLTGRITHHLMEILK